jgi:hypothetical protein
MEYRAAHGISYKGEVFDSEIRKDSKGYLSYNVNFTDFPILNWFNRLDDNWISVNPDGSCPYHSSDMRERIYEPIKWYYSTDKIYKNVQCTYADGKVRQAKLRINGKASSY